MDLGTIAELKQLDGIWVPRATRDIQVSYPADGHRVLFPIEEHSYWFQHRNKMIARAALGLIDHEDWILDVGGGNGFVSLGLQNQGFSVVTLESGADGVRNAKERGVRNVIRAEFVEAGFRPKSIPCVGLFDVLEHQKDDISFLSSLRARMRDGGICLITVPALRCLWSADDVSAGHYRRYELGGLGRALGQAGFEVVLSHYFFGVLTLPVFLMRTIPSLLKMRMRSNSDAVARDHGTQGGAGARLLRAMLTREFNRSNRGRYPLIGTSILCAAKVRA